MIKKIFTTAMAAMIVILPLVTARAEDAASQSKDTVFQGKVELNNNNNNQNKLFTGQTKSVKQGTQLKMTVSSVLSSGYNQEGDEFFAEITNDVSVPGGIIIPTGTVAHGRVTQMTQAKRLGRDAYIKVDFDYLVTPDGREIPIQASMTTKRNKAASVGKVVLEDTAYTVAGGVIGGVIALKVLGLGSAVASHGYTVAGGAGIGAIAGVTVSLVRKGKDVLIAPGDEIKAQIKSEVDLPVMSEDAFKDEEKTYDGLNVSITGYKLERDPFGEPNTITLDLKINNNTDKTFSSFDMALVSDTKSVYYPSPFANTEMWFQKIEPNARTTGELSFSVDNPKRKHWLVFYDGLTRKPLMKLSVYNAQKRLEKERTAKK